MKKLILLLAATLSVAADAANLVERPAKLRRYVLESGPTKETVSVRLSKVITKRDCNNAIWSGSFLFDVTQSFGVASYGIYFHEIYCPIEKPITVKIYSPYTQITLEPESGIELFIPEEFSLELNSAP